MPRCCNNYGLGLWRSSGWGIDRRCMIYPLRGLHWRRVRRTLGRRPVATGVRFSSGGALARKRKTPSRRFDQSVTQCACGEGVLARVSFALGMLGVIPVVVDVKSIMARLVACLVAVVLAAIVIRAMQLQSRGGLDRIFTTLVAALSVCTLAPLLYLVSNDARGSSGAAGSGPVLMTSVTGASPATLQGAISVPAGDLGVGSVAASGLALSLAGRRTAASSGWGVGEVQLDVRRYEHALVVDVCPLWQVPQSVVYVIDREYHVFRAVAGISDYAGGDGFLVFIVKGDGRQLYRQVAAVGRPLHVEARVDGVLRLELAIGFIDGENAPGGCERMLAAWADAGVE